MANIRDLARDLGLSTSTVSRALSDSPGVSEKTRRLVKQTAERMNYSVNRFAQNLVKRQSNVIGFMIPDISDSFFAKSAYGVEEAIQSSPFELAYTNVKRSPQKVCEYLRKAEEYCYAGAFVTIDEWTPAVQEQLRAMNIPVISLRRKTPECLADRIPYVDSDHVLGTEAIVGHLLEQGHREFGYIGFDTPVGLERAEAFRQVAKRRSLRYCEVSNISYHNAQIRISVGYSSAQRLLHEHPEITALCAGDDQLAIGALQYLRENQIDVPGDISLAGYDDRDIAQLFSIQLTTVHQQLFEIGQYAGAMMLERIDRPDAEYRSLSVPSTLRVRKTTGPVKTRF